MHRLVREVRFSVNPFLEGLGGGCNSFASKPSGEGLAVFLELCVELTGEVDGETGFVVNVTEIDEQVRSSAVPLFAERIRAEFLAGRHITLSKTAQMLVGAWGVLNGRFALAELSRLGVKLNPFRKLSIDSQDGAMVYFSEKFEFAATHKLWNDGFSEQRNFEVFGKCANPTGHGHNYVVEVTVKTPPGRKICVGDFEKIVDEQFIAAVDHKNLNVDVERFKTTIPTVENIALFAWDKLAKKFGETVLHCVTIWETDKTSCSYYG
ncbi:MAG: 6-carboxytetrahydropterin synthase [Sedimentisphaerales bacterium]|nr:6-carboxytetrahydropterin synthase [Sedimentisphaerales bacterium]